MRTFHSQQKLWLALFMCASLNVFASISPVKAFKQLLSQPNLYRKVTWAEFVPGGTKARFYTGASDGKNFYIRQYLPGENLNQPLSPTNKLGRPFFVGRSGKMCWEITGSLMINEASNRTSVIAHLANSGRLILDCGLTFGLSGVAPGKFVWTGNTFSVKREGPIPSKIVITRSRGPGTSKGAKALTITRGTNGHDVYAGDSSLTNALPFGLDLDKLSGRIWTSNNYVTKLESGSIVARYKYNRTDLPCGVPSSVEIGVVGQPKRANTMRLEILHFEVKKNTHDIDFEPTHYVADHDYRLKVWSKGHVKMRKDDPYSVSTRKEKVSGGVRRTAVLAILVAITLLLIFIFFRHR